MDIQLAQTAGFCFGVKRAVNQVYDEIENGGILYTYGPIIHNHEVVNDLMEKGVKVLNTEEELEALEEGTVILRSHGVPKAIIDLLERKGIRYIDMTCPFVKRIHRIVAQESPTKEIVIIGNEGHPEVEGIRGWAEKGATVIGSLEEAQQYRPKTKAPICVVAQTTFNYKKFQDFVDVFEKNKYNVIVVNTICDATQKRQEEAAKISAEVDAMIVIGDYQSSNSKKLYEICKQHCEHTFFIQTLCELTLEPSSEFRRIGITAGASTPNNIIEEVQNYVRANF